MPIVHFVVGGALLFRLVHGVAPLVAAHATASRAPIVLTADDVARLRSDYLRETGLEPTADDEAALVDKALDEELLFREALARGLDQGDRSVHNWLVEQMQVLEGERAGDPEQLYGRARALGLDRTDLVVRRILVQKMRLLAARTAERPPSDAELEAFYAAHRDDYRAPDRVSFWHVFLASERHGRAAGADANALLDGIRRDRLPPDQAVRQGESFTAPSHLAGQAAPQVAKLFGPAVAAAVQAGEPLRWIGPVASPYGVHLLWIESREAGTVPPLVLVRGQVVERWRDEQRAVHVTTLLRELKRRYPFEVQSSAWRDRSRS